MIEVKRIDIDSLDFLVPSKDQVEEIADQTRFNLPSSALLGDFEMYGFPDVEFKTVHFEHDFSFFVKGKIVRYGSHVNCQNAVETRQVDKLSTKRANVHIHTVDFMEVSLVNIELDDPTIVLLCGCSDVTELFSLHLKKGEARNFSCEPFKWI